MTDVPVCLCDSPLGLPAAAEGVTSFQGSDTVTDKSPLSYPVGIWSCRSPNRSSRSSSTPSIARCSSLDNLLLSPILFSQPPPADDGSQRQKDEPMCPPYEDGVPISCTAMFLDEWTPARTVVAGGSQAARLRQSQRLTTTTTCGSLCSKGDVGVVSPVLLLSPPTHITNRHIHHSSHPMSVSATPRPIEHTQAPTPTHRDAHTSALRKAVDPPKARLFLKAVLTAAHDAASPADRPTFRRGSQPIVGLVQKAPHHKKVPNTTARSSLSSQAVGAAARVVRSEVGSRPNGHPSAQPLQERLVSARRSAGGRRGGQPKQPTLSLLSQHPTRRAVHSSSKRKSVPEHGQALAAALSAWPLSSTSSVNGQHRAHHPPSLNHDLPSKLQSNHITNTSCPSPRTSAVLEYTRRGITKPRGRGVVGGVHNDSFFEHAHSLFDIWEAVCG